MRIIDLLKTKKRIFSFEFFPPKNNQDADELYKTIEELLVLKPDFVSITNSSTGIAPYRTVALSGVIKKKLGIEVMAHLTCISHTKEEISQIVQKLKELEIENILALRGDVHNTGKFKIKRDYRFAYELVSDLKKSGNFSIGVAGYPEKHPESKDFNQDINCLKQKIDCGADFVITQLFFDNRFYHIFVERCRKAGIKVPIIPGIMPITAYKQVQNFTKMFGVSLPKIVIEKMNKFANDKQSFLKFSMEYSVNQCERLLKDKVPGIHFYTLNKSKITKQILELIKTQR